jgi:FkbM family methyltransferase
MLHANPLVSGFIALPEFRWKNGLRHWLARSRLVPDWIQDYSPIKGYELHRKLSAGDVVMDVGAYPGDYTLFAAGAVGPDGQVYALEPDPVNRLLLERVVDRSGFSNIRILPVGLWDCKTTLHLTSAALSSHISEASDHSTPIQVVPLDTLAADIGLLKLDVLKMDIEGAELQALEGAQQTLATLTPYTCIASYHLVEGANTSSRVETALARAGLHPLTDYPKHLTTYGKEIWM